MRSFFLLAALVSLSSCTSLVLRPVEYAWPVERVLEVDGKGIIHDDRYMLTMNVRPLFYEETQDSVNVYGQAVRIIRDNAGYYFMTAKGFRNVYIFTESEGAMSLSSKVAVSEGPMRDPAFNQRQPYIQLLNGSNAPQMLNADGLVEEEKP
jgi:hypothetical protein